MSYLTASRLADAASLAWLAVSLALLIRWATLTRGGRNDLRARPIRENYLQLPVILLIVLAFLSAAAVLGRLGMLARPPSTSQPAELATRGEIRNLLGQLLLNTVIVALILPIADTAFANGLRGFGLALRGFWRNTRTGLGYLLAIFPVSLAVLALTAEFFQWRHWRITEHPLLQTVQSTRDPLLIAVSLVMAVVVAPVAEEIFFRGIVQSFLVRFFRVMMPPRGFPAMALWLNPPESRRAGAEAAIARARTAGELPPDDLEAPSEPPSAGGQAAPLSPAQEGRRAIAAILVSSALFAAVHVGADPHSVPAIFVLALALGYAYEKTGSLITNIAMHMAFNLLNMVFFFIQLGGK